LASIRCPTAVIWGRRDPFLSAAIATDLAARIPGARLTMLEHTGHFVTEERPDEVLRALTDLLGRGA